MSRWTVLIRRDGSCRLIARNEPAGTVPFCALFYSAAPLPPAYGFLYISVQKCMPFEYNIDVSSTINSPESKETEKRDRAVCYNYSQEPSSIRIETGKGTDMADELSLYRYWLEKLPADDPLHAELEAVEGDEKEIGDRFYQEIVFGTAGLRGICGAGTNRMNRLTVGRATKGIADFILGSGEDPEAGVAIAYDCRYFSKEFSELAASILMGSGIHVYLFPSMRPTPELSFAIRKYGTVSGINMTASHNPKEYNGYKVYWKDGAQISGSVSDGILERIQKLDLFDDFGGISLEQGKEK